MVMDDLTGTQIGRDGRRYPIGDPRLLVPSPPPRVTSVNGMTGDVVVAAGAETLTPTEIHDLDVLPDEDAIYFIHASGLGTPTVTMPSPVTVGRRITIAQLDDGAACHVAANPDGFLLGPSQVNVSAVTEFLGLGAIYPPELTTVGFWAVMEHGVPN